MIDCGTEDRYEPDDFTLTGGFETHVERMQNGYRALMEAKGVSGDIIELARLGSEGLSRECEQLSQREKKRGVLKGTRGRIIKDHELGIEDLYSRANVCRAGPW